MAQAVTIFAPNNNGAGSRMQVGATIVSTFPASQPEYTVPPGKRLILKSGNAILSFGSGKWQLSAPAGVSTYFPGTFVFGPGAVLSFLVASGASVAMSGFLEDDI